MIFLPVVGVMFVTRLPGLVALVMGYLSLDHGPAVDVDIYAYAQTLVTSLVVFAFFHALLEPIALGVTYVAAAHAHRGQPWSLGHGVAETFRRFGAVISVGAAYYGVVYGLWVIATLGGVAVTAAGFVAAGGDLRTAMMLFLGGGAVCAASLPLSAWFGLRYGFALPEAILNPAGSTMRSFAHSAALMRGAYLPAAILVVLLIAIQSGLAMLASSFIPAPAPQALTEEAFFAVLPSLIRAQLLQQIVGVLISAAFAIYAGACWVVLYERRLKAVQPTGHSTTPAAS